MSRLRTHLGDRIHLQAGASEGLRASGDSMASLSSSSGVRVSAIYSRSLKGCSQAKEGLEVSAAVLRQRVRML